MRHFSQKYRSLRVRAGDGSVGRKEHLLAKAQVCIPGTHIKAGCGHEHLDLVPGADRQGNHWGFLATRAAPGSVRESVSWEQVECTYTPKVLRTEIKNWNPKADIYSRQDLASPLA